MFAAATPAFLFLTILSFLVLATFSNNNQALVKVISGYLSNIFFLIEIPKASFKKNIKLKAKNKYI